MEALCRLSYPGGREMIATPPPEPRMTCHDVRMRRALIAIVALLSFISCAKDEPTVGAGAITSVRIHTDDGSVRLSVETADTPAEREHGLMGRTSLGSDDGMVFVFDGPTDGSFWMKDTLIPLSVAFWSEGGRIVGLRDMDPCTADPCPTYGSPEPYVGALEVNRGFFEEHGVVIGDRVELS
jgi:uncharacterized protein